MIMVPQTGQPQVVPCSSGALIVPMGGGRTLQTASPTAAHIADDAQYTHAHAHHYTHPPAYAESQSGEMAHHHPSGGLDTDASMRRPLRMHAADRARVLEEAACHRRLTCARLRSSIHRHHALFITSSLAIDA
jgi:hypothetical protein